MTAPTLRPVPSGRGTAQSSATATRDLGEVVVPALDRGYVETEHLFSGTARLFEGSVAHPGPVDTGQVAAFTTRVLVRHPADAARFSGRVVVEPLNTSNGPDVDALWGRVWSLLESEGDGWVGVSVRASSARLLSDYDPERYGELDLAANDVEWDLLRQLGTVLKSPGALSGMTVERLYLAGFSQSGADTATFALAFHDASRLPDGRAIIDGYFPAAHSASLTPLQSAARTLPAFEYAPLGPIGVPVVDVETQTDVEGFASTLSSGQEYISCGGASVRRPDSDDPSDRYRLWEVAGAPHVARRKGCDGPGSTFPTEAFLRAGLAALYRWVEHDVAPPMAPRLTLATDGPVSVAAVDADGNALGGVRAPHLDVPLGHYAAHTQPGPHCALVGHETPFPAADLIARYGDPAGYQSAFAARLDECIAGGFLLEGDRAALLAAETAKAEAAFADGDRQHDGAP